MPITANLASRLTAGSFHLAPLSSVAWTTVTHCATASPTEQTNWRAAWSQFRTLSPGSWSTGTRRCDHISPVLRQLHWLPVRQRAVFKIGTLVHRSLSGNAPGYLADDCQLVADARVRQLRSVDTRTLVVSRDAQQFWRQELRRDAAVGPQVWDSLPPNLRLRGLSYGQFRRLLKTFLFGHWGHAQCELFLTASDINILTYLLTYLMAW